LPQKTNLKEHQVMKIKTRVRAGKLVANDSQTLVRK
jgi:hypothetical protein